MCGIFGLVAGKEAGLGRPGIESLIKTLFLLSESRGKEAAGLAVRGASGIRSHKQAVAAGRMVRSAAYREFLDGALGEGGAVAVIGHSRLVTNGSQLREDNNQPCLAEGLALVHNGIIVNDADLWRENPDLRRQGEVDSEVLVKLIGKLAKAGKEPAEAAAAAFAVLRGSASIALLGGREEILLATNTGSLYALRSGDLSLFASERFILEEAAKSGPWRNRPGTGAISQVKPGTGLLLSSRPAPEGGFRLGRPPEPPPPFPRGLDRGTPIGIEEEPPRLRRCARCILPETMPFVDFDAEGVCRYCRIYRPMRPQGPEALEKILSRYRSKDGSPDALVAFSGGRDSCYGLHLLKRELGMHPAAFTYDWGMVTDLARRNQARLCGQLGVEHVLVSADIARKRGNIRRNVEAWLRKPHLGMIPLLMAGDKQFFHHANRLRESMGIKLVVYCENPLEVTNFKTGYMGIKERGGKAYNLSAAQRLGLGLSYVRQFLANPGYLNRSLVDTALAYASTYLIRHDYLYLFDYLRWEEGRLDRTLLDGYGWETSPDTPSTWRIGDGTAAFYNFAYLTLAGFTEFDTFRSNQIREGVLTRDRALALVAAENRTRWDSLREYAATVGFDAAEAVRIIRNAPRLYARDRAGK